MRPVSATFRIWRRFKPAKSGTSAMTLVHSLASTAERSEGGDCSGIGRDTGFSCLRAAACRSGNATIRAGGFFFPVVATQRFRQIARRAASTETLGMFDHVAPAGFDAPALPE